MESKFDWLTLTIKPENPNYSSEAIFSRLSEDLLLKDLIVKMNTVPRVAFYSYCIGYENITLCYPSPDRLFDQGFCLRFSSQGLDFFTRYLKSYNITLKQWLGMFRALCFKGCVTKCTRIDYAMDDIHFNCEAPVITMDKIVKCCRKGEVCKKARVIDVLDGGTFALKERIKTVGGDPVVGRTLNFGSRQSEVFCRFYDKLAEQRQKKQPIPDDCTSWTRCEFEFKHGAAMGVLNAFIDYDDDDFGNYMRGIINNYVSFISRTNNNISRCPVKKWWTDFLCGCIEKFKLPHRQPARSAYAKAQRGLNQYVSIIYTMYRVLGAFGVYKFFKRLIDRKILNKADLYKPELANNILDAKFDYEYMNAFKNYQYHSDIDIKDSVNKHLAYCSYTFRAHHLSEQVLERHLAFMDGLKVAC